jgi:hypothetical protein
MNKFEKKMYWILMASIFTIAAMMFINLFIKSKNARIRWIEYEMQERTINDYVYIGKNVFVQLDTFWFSVIGNPVFEDLDPIGCIFSKEKGGAYYKISCKDTTINLWSGSGGFITDKIWLRRINMALDKENRRKEKLKH